MGYRTMGRHDSGLQGYTDMLWAIGYGLYGMGYAIGYELWAMRPMGQAMGYRLWVLGYSLRL